MTIPALPALNRASPTFRSDLDSYFLTNLPATTGAINSAIGEIEASAQAAAASAENASDIAAAAAGSVSAAAAQVVLATEQVTLANDARDSAQAFASSAINAPGTSATSTTSLTIEEGSKSLIIQTGKLFSVGQWVVISSTASPSNQMSGQITAHDNTTGVLSVSVSDLNGAGVFESWVIALTPSGARKILQRTITAADTLLSTDNGKLINASGTFTLSVTAAATLSNGWWCYVRNTSNGDVTLYPGGSELIGGAATYLLKPGFVVLLNCNGSAFDIITIKARSYENHLLVTSTSTFTVPPDTYALRGYAVGRGGDGFSHASTWRGGAGGGMAYGDMAVQPGQVVSIDITSGVVQVIVSGVTLLTGNPASGHTTAGTASIHASVRNGGAYSGGVSALGGGASSGSPLGGGVIASSTGGCGWGGASAGEGGGGVGAAPSTPSSGGPGLSPTAVITEPLLRTLIGLGGAGTQAAGDSGADGGPGGGGGKGGASGVGGKGGFGGGGGRGQPSGAGGFGGGGGGAVNSTGGSGGYGGGGGGSNSASGAGGPAAVYFMY